MTELRPANIPNVEVDRMEGELLRAWHAGKAEVLSALQANTPEEAAAKIGALVRAMARDEYFRNDTYQVCRAVTASAMGPLVHLSIRRLDRKPVHDWRDLQEIKNQLVGPEMEAVELYPAESRCMDVANQFHLWCLPIAGKRFPLGFDGPRTVSGESPFGGVQRPLN